jgi:hypothetical protein
MDELRLRQIFVGVVNCSLLLGMQGCSGATAADPPLVNAGNGGNAGSGGSGAGLKPHAEPFWTDLDLSEFAPPICSNHRWLPMQGLNPAEPVDYAGLYSKTTLQPNADQVDATGTACANAYDAPACQKALAAATAAVPTDQSCGAPYSYGCQSFLLTSTGDRVETWLLPDDLFRFLGPIDTPQEALLLITYGSRDPGHYGVDCDVPDQSSVRTTSDGYDVVATSLQQICAPILVTRNLLHVTADASEVVLRSNIAEVSDGCIGRRPEGLAARVDRRDGCVEKSQILGEFYASISYLEAASVEAFLRLARELEALGAPLDLQLAAQRAAEDEVRHAEHTRQIAERFGGRVFPPVVAALGPRELERVACENIMEGCVRETYGALLAHHQARRSRDPEIRSLMQRIAEDETRHAALAWRVAAWAEPRLSPAERERVRQSRERALTELRTELTTSVPAELCELAGVPSAPEALQLFAGLERALWNQYVPAAA